jgi:hypothetical protein
MIVLVSMMMAMHDCTKYSKAQATIITVYNDLTVKLIESSYFPGEGLKVNYSSPVELDSLTIYEVPTSYKNDPSKFDNPSTKVVKVYPNPSTDNRAIRELIIDWTNPAMYQAVAYSNNGTIIRGISDTFKVKATTSNTKASVTVDRQSYVIGQNITTSIKRDDGTPYETQIVVYVVPAGASSPETLLSFVDWFSRQNTIKTTGKIPWLDNGWYKAIAYVNGTASSYRLGSSRAFQVLNPIKISMPRRTFIEGEFSNITLFNPLNLAEYVPDCLLCRPSLSIIPVNFTNSGESFTPYVYGTDGKDIQIIMAPGKYNFAVTRRIETVTSLIHVIPNSTFDVLPNPGTVRTDKKIYKVGEKISMTLTTRNKNVYPGKYIVWIVDPTNNQIRDIPVSITNVASQLTASILVDWVTENFATVFVAVQLPWYEGKWSRNFIWAKSDSIQITN